MTAPSFRYTPPFGALVQVNGTASLMPANFADSTSVKWFFIPNGPNAGSISAFAVNSGSPDWLNVQGYGADPTGTNDSTSAFQSAINACTSTQGIVYVPGGSYVISSALIGNPNFAGLIGDGVHLSILKVPASSSANSILTHTSTPDGFKMSGLSFQGPGQTASGGQNGVTLSNSGGNVSDAIFEDLWFNGWPGYGFEVDSPIVSSFRNIRVLFSNKGLFINGGTSCSIISCYMNQITKTGYDLKGVGYSSLISCAADTNGLAYLIRNASQAISIVGCGHEAGTSFNLTVTNTALTSNVATITYSGPDQSAEFFTGMEVVVAGTTNGSGALNGRQTISSVGTNTISFALTHANITSASDSGTASMFAGDGIGIADSSGVTVNSFEHVAAAQATSVIVYVDGNSAATTLTGIVSVTGSGTPQTDDLWIATNSSNTIKWNNVLIGGSVNNGAQVTTMSSATITTGALAQNLSGVAAAGFVRLNKTGTINYRNNANSADNVLSVNSSDRLQFNSNQIPDEVATLSLTAQAAALSGHSLFTPSVSGLYRISFVSKVTQAATNSSTLGGSTGFTVTYTDAVDSTASVVVAAPGGTNTGNALTSAASSSVIVNAAASAVTISYGYTSSGATAMQYDIQAVVEAL
jgi:Pectate lyase superfamily protein